MRKRTATNTSEGIKNIIANQLRDDEERLNVRDFTDFIFDPTDPIDVGIAGLAATGVGLPAAAIAKVGNTGRKIGKGVASLLPKARDNAIKNYFKYYLGRELYEAPELIEEVSRMREGGLIQDIKSILDPTDIQTQIAQLETDKAAAPTRREQREIQNKINALNKDLQKTSKPKVESQADKRGRISDKEEEDESTVIPPVTLAGNGDDNNDGDNNLGRDEANRRLGILGDPAFQRALIAGGAAMMKPTEGLGRSFLGLGEFGEAFSDSLSKSEAQKSDVERLHEIRVRAAEAEGTKIPSFEETYALVLNQSGAQDASELNNTFIAAETLLQKTTNIKDPKIEDFEVDGEKLASVLARTDGSATAVADAVAKAVYTPKEEEPGLGSRISNFFSGD
jgi:DNA-binding transcriptional MerR regulator